MMRGFGMPEPLYSDLAAGTAIGHDRWHPHAVWLGSELVGTATLAVRDNIGQLFAGAVLPHARQRDARPRCSVPGRAWPNWIWTPDPS